MLKKRERLTTAEFNRWFAAGRRYHGVLLLLIYIPTPTPAFKAAAVVGKKVSKTAVGRNRLRRQIYAAIDVVRTTESLTGVYIVIAKPAAASATMQDLAADLRQLVGRIRKAR